MAQVETQNRATSSEDSRKRVHGRIEKEGIEFVLLWFTDIEGHLKSFAVTPSEIEAALDDGMGFDGSSITGFNAIEESDMVAIPDPETFQLMPWKEGETRVARMICDIVTPDGKPYEGDPRYVLRRALDRMASLGFDTFNVGPELEYFLFRDDKGTETLDEGGYFAMTTLDAASELRQETVRALEGMGIPIEYVHHEVGPSQHEIDMRFSDALSMADHTVTYRLIVKEIAKKSGYHATFMPKPIFGENGSGHAHAPVAVQRRAQRVLRRRRRVEPLRRREGVHRRPAAARARDQRGVRPVGELVQAARAGLRGAGVRRLVAAEPLGAHPDPPLQARRRAGDAGGDPLSRPGLQPVPDVRRPAPCRPRGDRAGLRAARADGDEPLPPDAEQRKERGIVSLPETLGEAVDALAGSELVRKALGPHIFDRYVELKRAEWDEYRVQLTEWELKKYLSVL